jgi:endonuclease/exonuclease/phosphatase family metal-dependent hydrolase
VLAPDRIAAVIRELDADIIGLQEVDAQHRADRFLDQWLYLAQATGYHCVPGISLRTHRRAYGNAVLTRQPPETIRLHDISVPGREPRGVIDLDLAFPERKLRLIATHLGLRHGERRDQIDQLMRLVAGDDDGSATILVGDLNEWLRGSHNLRRLGAAFAAGPAPASFPAGRPILALDRISARGAVRIASAAAHRSPLARIASDHLPVRALVEWQA